MLDTVLIRLGCMLTDASGPVFGEVEGNGSSCPWAGLFYCYSTVLGSIYGTEF
jgi:hypothetical protein